jgi:hypothetical protein
MERLRAIWARWRLARLEKQRRHEERHIGRRVYDSESSPRDRAHGGAGREGEGGGGAFI